MSRAVFCIATSFGQAESIVTQLQNKGFPASEISILVPDTTGRHDIGHVRATKAPEGATTGVTAGGLLGGLAGFLIGIGALAIPGLGAFIAAGPLMAALSGAAVGATAGGVVGCLIGYGIPEFEAKRYEHRLQSGNYLISVHADDRDRVAQARKIFEGNGAEDIAVSSEAAVPAA